MISKMSINLESTLLEPSLFCIKAILILDYDGSRLIGKYYDDTFPTPKEKKAFERNLFNKTHKADGEIIMLDGLTCVYKSSVDLFFYVIGDSNENGLILLNVLNCLFDSIYKILRKNVEWRYLMENLDIIVLAVDEICDRGIILDNDSVSVVQKVVLKNEDLLLGDQTVSQVFQNAKEQIKWSLLG